MQASTSSSVFIFFSGKKGDEVRKGKERDAMMSCYDSN